jgi:nucleotide-binding universal stress UspA family protein
VRTAIAGVAREPWQTLEKEHSPYVHGPCATLAEMFGTILVASNGSETADRALAAAERLARDGRSRVVLAHIIEVMTRRGAQHPVNPAEDWLLTKFRLQVAAMNAAGVNAALEMRTASGEPTRVLAEIAEACEADLIVTGSSGRSVIGEVVLGSVGRRLLRLASCPVLVVPRNAK